MYHFLGYGCSICGSEYAPDQVSYTCPKDGGNLDIILDFKKIRKILGHESFLSQEASIWRYLPLLPVTDPGTFGRGTPFRSVGFTPVFSPPYLRRHLGLRQLWIKDESRNPTASFKDRASAVVIRRAAEIGAETIVCASTGNAGVALAGLAAAVGQNAVIFTPRNAPEAKVAQLLVYGARVLLVDGTYDQTMELSFQAAETFGWYCRNTGINPFTLEGKKTAAYEIWEAIREGSTAHTRIAHTNEKPLSVFVSVGDGNIISGLHKGFKDLQIIGWMDTMPKLYGVQAKGSAAIAKAYEKGTEIIQPVTADTLADSIRVGMPADGVRALKAARQTGGSYITVGDDQILSAVSELGKAGIFAEPAGAAAFAGLVKAVQEGIVKENDPVLVINTGSGLKDVRAAGMSVPGAPIIEPAFSSVRKHLSPGS